MSNKKKRTIWIKICIIILFFCGIGLGFAFNLLENCEIYRRMIVNIVK
jgi:hypothetical protein